MKKHIYNLIFFWIACFLCGAVYGAIQVFVLGIIPDKFRDFPWIAFQVHAAVSVLAAIYATLYFLVLIFVLQKLKQEKLSAIESFSAGIITILIKIVLGRITDNSIDLALLLIPSLVISYIAIRAKTCFLTKRA